MNRVVIHHMNFCGDQNRTADTSHNDSQGHTQNESKSDSESGESALSLARIKKQTNAIMRAAALYALAFERKKNTAVHIASVDEKLMRSYNAQFRGKDAVTDVLSFVAEPDSFADSFMGEGAFAGPETPTKSTVAGAPKTKRTPAAHAGDLIVCIPYIAKQAARFKQPFHTELSRTVIHGVLHLLGYSHASYKKSEPMLALQERILSLLEAEQSPAVA